MPSLTFDPGTFPTRLCVILTSNNTGGPISGVPFFAHASVSVSSASAAAAPDANNNTSAQTLDIPLGTLATDAAGYLSYDLSTLERRLDDLVEVQAATTSSTPTISIDHLWLHPYSPIAQSIDALAEQNVRDDALVLRLMVDPGSVYQSDRSGFASMQTPGLTDWYLSPGSFAHMSAEIVGLDGCETLLPSNIATQSFQFVQILPLQTTFKLKSIDRNSFVKQPVTNLQGAGVQTIAYTSKSIASSIAGQSQQLLPRLGATGAQAGLAMYVLYDATWLPVGHGLGQILYSLPLAPAEQVNIAIIDWSRTSTDSRVEDTGLTDTLQHETNRDRTVGEVVDASLKEWQRGGSVMGGTSVTGGFGGFVGGAASIGGAYQTSSGDRDISASTVQNLTDRFTQSSTSIRDLRSTVVIQSVQSETQQLSTRTVRNYNHSHAMTVLYYEVLRHYRVVIERGDVGPALLLPQDMPDFSDVEVFEQRRFLQPSLLLPELDGGFDAIEKYYAWSILPLPPVADPAAVNLTVLIITLQVTMPAIGGGTLHVKAFLNDGSSIDLLSPDPGKTYGELQHDGDFQQSNQANVFNATPAKPLSRRNLSYFEFTFVLGGDDSHPEIKALGIAGATVIGVDANGVSNMLAQWGSAVNWAPHNSNPFTWPLITNPPPPLPPPVTPSSKLTDDENLLRVRLIAHLNSNKSYYYKQIWMAEEPNARAIRLENVTVQIGSQTLPLLSVVENRVIDVAGTSLVLPMDPSYFDTAPLTDQQRQTMSLPVLAHARSEKLLSLPTRGVFGEAKLGHCNASEVIDNTRFWDWQTSPIPDSAPAITGIAPVSANVTQNLTPTTLPTSVLSIQQPAPAPDPIGLRAALDVLKTPGIFNNMSGIQQLQGLLTTLTNAAVQAQGIGLQAVNGTSGGKGGSASGGSTGASGGSTSTGGGASTGGGTSGSGSAPISGGTSAGGTASTGGTGAGSTTSDGTTSTTSSDSAAPIPEPTSVTGGTVPATVVPPTTKPAMPAKAVGTRQATLYFWFRDPDVQFVSLSVVGQENTSAPNVGYEDLYSSPVSGGTRVAGLMSLQNAADSIDVAISAVVQYSGGKTQSLDGRLTAKPPASGSVWTFDVEIQKSPETATVTSGTSVTNEGIREAIANQLQVSAGEVASWNLSSTTTLPAVDTTTTSQTQWTYTVDLYRGPLKITQTN